MKCHVVRDKKGKVVAVGYIDRSDLESYDSLTPRFGPVAEADQTVVVLDMPDEYLKMSSENLIERITADTQQHEKKSK